MRRTAKGIIAGVSLIAAIVAAAVAVPAMMDVQGYKPDLERRLSASLGREVKLDGKISASLLPQPALTAQGARLANLPGLARTDMVRAESLSVRLALLPLLRGQVVADSVVVDSAQISLQRTPTGQPNWSFAKIAAPQGEAAPPNSAAAPSDESPSPVRRISLRNTVVRLDGVAGPLRQIDDLDAALSMADDGGWQAEGTALLHGHQVEARLRHGAGGELDARLQAPAAKGDLQLSGRLDGGRFSGKLQLAAAQPGVFAPGRLPNASLQIGATVVAQETQAALDQLSIVFGQTRAVGDAFVDWQEMPTGSLRLKAGLLDLDQLLSVPTVTPPPAQAPRPSPPAPAQEQAASPAPESKAGGELAAAPPPPPGFSLPRDLSIDLDLSAEQIRWRGGLIREGRLGAALSGGELTFNQVSAMLPGDTSLAGFGFLVVEDGHPAAELTVEAQSPNLRAALEWLKADVASVPPDRLRQASAGARLQWTPTELRVSDGWTRIDTTRADLAAIVRLGLDRPSFGASLVIDRLDLDAYRPRPAAEVKPALAPQSAPAAAPAAAPAPNGAAPAAPTLRGPAFLDGFDASLQLRVGELRLDGRTIRQAAFDGTVMRGDIAIREASIADLAGSAIRLTGTVAAASTHPELRDVTAELRTRKPVALFQMLGEDPADVSRFESIVVSSTLDGTEEALKTATRVEAGGAILSLNGLVARPLSPERRYDLTLEASHSELTDVVRLLGGDYHTAAPLGAFAASGKLSGGARAAELKDLRLKLGAVSAAGDVKADWSAKPRLDARLTTNEILVPPFLPVEKPEAGKPAPQRLGGLLAKNGEPPKPPPAATPAPLMAGDARLPLPGLRRLDATLALDAAALVFETARLDDASLRLSLQDGLLKLEPLSGMFFGGRLRAVGQIDPKGDTRGTLLLSGARLREALVQKTGFDLLEGSASLGADFTAHGASRDELLRSLSGKGLLDVKDGLLRGFDLSAASQRMRNLSDLGGLLGLLQAGLTGGATKFSTLSGTFSADKGVLVSDDLRLVADGGVGTGEARLDLPGEMVKAAFAFALSGQGDAPPVVLRIEGPMASPKKVVDFNDLQRYLAGKGVGRALGGSLGKALQGLLHPPSPTPAPRPQVGSEPLPAPGEAPKAPAAKPAPPPEDPRIAALRSQLREMKP